MVPHIYVKSQENSSDISNTKNFRNIPYYAIIRGILEGVDTQLGYQELLLSENMSLEKYYSTGISLYTFSIWMPCLRR